MNWFEKLFNKTPGPRLPVVDPVICRFKSCAVAATYRAYTGYQCGVAVGWIKNVPHAQACVFPDDDRIPLTVYRTGQVGPGEWDLGFLPERFVGLTEFASTVFKLERR